MDDPERAPSDPRSPGTASGGVVSIGIAVAFALSMGGGLGVALGAMLEDFRAGLKWGAAFGVVVGAALYWFVLRDRRG